MEKLFKSLSLISILTLCSCTSIFTKKDYEYFTDINNYQEYTVNLDYFTYEYRADNSPNFDKQTSMYVTFQSLDDFQDFNNYSIAEDDLVNYPCGFIIVEENSKLLNSINFYEEIREVLKCQITIKVCNYYIHSSYYRFVASIKKDDHVYLNELDGINGIGKHIQNNKSAFY